MKNSKTFRLFISSTFNDFREERRMLQMKVFPEIKKYCSEKGYSFQPIDLRWGINEEAQLDQKTLELCLEEVRACKAYPHPNFLVMLGDRYGWIPLPYAIEKNEFNEILNHINDKAILLEWYQLDENQLPASYILKHREEKYTDMNVWSKKENELLTTLQKAVEKTSLSEEQKRKYFTSATEAEIEEGIIPYLKPTAYQEKILLNNPNLLKEDTEYIFGFFRNIDKSNSISDIFITDDYPRAQELKKKVKEILLDINIYECKTIQLNTDKLDYSYLSIFEEKLINFLKEKLDTQIAKEISYSELEIEKQEQEYFAMQKRNNFIGQEYSLNIISDYISSNNQQPFVLYGKSGSGKSSLMAKAIEIAKQKTNSKIVFRFVGATANSSTTISLLTSILEELGKNIRIKKNENFNEFSERAKNEILKLQDDIVFFIDAVDQLTNNDRFLWLPEKLPKNLKVIISALDDTTYKDDTCYFEQLKEISSNIHQLKPFNQPKELLLNLLNAENRTIQKHQLHYFLKQYNNSNTPLYIYVAAQEIKYWKSFDLVEGQKLVNNQKVQDLANSQKGIIKEFINNLSNFFHHDKEFVQKILSYIYTSIDGLSENELLELINTDKSFIKRIAPDIWHKNANKELPLAIWARLYTQLKPFLSKKNQDNEELLFFFHREFTDAIKNISDIKLQNKNIIGAVLKKIKKHQFDDFYKNRWGRLYALLIFSYTKNYKIRKNSKWFSEFLIIQEAYSKTFIQWLLNQWDLYTNSNSEFLMIAYSISKLLYEKDPERWGEAYTFSINDLAYYYSQINKLKITLKLEKKALKIREKRYLKYHEWEDEYTTSLLNISNTYSALSDIDAAISYAKKALIITERNFDKDPDNWLENYIINLNHLASYYKSKNYLSKALIFSKKAYVIVTKYIKKNPNVWAEQYVITIRDLADLYFTNNQFKEAQNLNIENLKIVEELYKKDNEKWAYQYIATLNQIATTFHELNDISASIKYETKAYNLVSKLLDKNKDYWMRSYLQIVNNLNYNNPNIDVLSVFIEAKEICEKLYNKLPERWGGYFFSILNNIGYYYLDNEINLKEVFKLFKESHKIIKSFFTKNPDNWIEQYLGSLNNLASYYLEISETKKAIKILKDAYNLISEYYKKEPNRWTKDYVLFLSNLSYAYANDNQFEKAFELEKKNYEILKQLYLSEKKLWIKEYSKSLKNLAFLYKEIKKVNKAISLEKEALKIVRNLYKKDKIAWVKELVYVLNNLAFSYSLKQNVKKAKYYYNQVMLLIEELYKENNYVWAKEYATILNSYSELFTNPEIQLKYVLKSYEIIEKQYRNQKNNWIEEYLSSLLNLAYAYKEINEINKAIKLEKKFLKIIKTLYNKNKNQWRKDYILGLNNFAYSHHLKNKHTIAIKYEKKILTIIKPLFKKNPYFWFDDYVIGLNNIGVSYREIKQFNIAEAKLLEALNIIENFFEDDNDVYKTEYQLVLDNLLTLYEYMENKTKVKTITNKMVKIKK